MNAQGHDTGLDGGMFGFTLPMGIAGWIMFILGIAIFAVGIILTIPAISAIGILLVGFSAPSELQVKLHNIRKKMRPSEVAWQSEMGGTELVSFGTEKGFIDRKKICAHGFFPHHLFKIGIYKQILSRCLCRVNRRTPK